ncbi:MAG: hypothetical protein V4864_09730 [Pseudomonadota bacterium]
MTSPLRGFDDEMTWSWRTRRHRSARREVMPRSGVIAHKEHRNKSNGYR